MLNLSGLIANILSYLKRAKINATKTNFHSRDMLTMVIKDEADLERPASKEAKHRKLGDSDLQTFRPIRMKR